MPTSIEEGKIEKIRSDIIQYITGGETSRELIFQIENIKINNPELNEILVLLHSEYHTQSKKDKKMISKMITDLLALDFRNVQAIHKLERDLQDLIHKMEKMHAGCNIGYYHTSQPIVTPENITPIEKPQVKETKVKIKTPHPSASRNNSNNSPLNNGSYKNYIILAGASLVLILAVYLFNPESGERLARDVVTIIKAIKGTPNDNFN